MEGGGWEGWIVCMGGGDSWGAQNKRVSLDGPASRAKRSTSPPGEERRTERSLPSCEPNHASLAKASTRTAPFTCIAKTHPLPIEHHQTVAIADRSFCVRGTDQDKLETKTSY